MTKAPDRTPWDGVIVTDSEICMGKARFAGTRHYIDHLLAQMEGGRSFSQILDDYPELKREQLMAMMSFLRDLVAAKRNKLKSERNG